MYNIPIKAENDLILMNYTIVLVYGRQILTSEVEPRTERINIL